MPIISHRAQKITTTDPRTQLNFAIKQSTVQISTIILDLAQSASCAKSKDQNGETYRESKVEDELERELSKFFEETIAENDEG